MNATARLVVAPLIAPPSFAPGEEVVLRTREAAGTFVGRARELGRLQAVLDDAARGAGGLFLVAGRAGMGKTRLLEELGQLASARGFRVRWGRCWESDRATVFWPWTQIFTGLMDDPCGPADAMALAPIFPGLTAATSGAETSAARLPTFRAALGQLAAQARDRPLLLVLDDLHAADESTLHLLRFLATQLHGLRILILGAYRQSEVPRGAALAEPLGRMTRETVGLQLGPLAPEAVTALVRCRLPGLDETTEVSIVRATLGNPFYVDQMLRGFEAEGPRRHLGQLCVPEGLAEVLERHLGRLPAEVQAALQVAAVLGDDFGSHPLATMLGLPLPVLEGRLEEAVTAGVLVAGEHHRHAFASELFRLMLYRALAPQRRAALHGEAARVLEASAPADPSPGRAAGDAAQLAHHLLEAGPSALEPAVNAALAAAEKSLHVLAHEDARALLTRAQAALGAQPGLCPLRARLHLAQAVAEYRGGDLPRARALYLQALAAARGLADGEILAAVACAEGVELADLPDLCRGLAPVAILREALAALPEGDSAVRARVLARLAAAQPPATGVAGSIELGRAAIAMARRVGHPPTLLAVLHESMSAMMDFIHPEERLALDSELERLCTEQGDSARSLRANGRLVFDHLGRGDLARADGCIATYERLAAQLPPGQGWRVSLFRALRALMEGRFAEAETAAATAEADALRLGDLFAGASLGAHRLASLRTREDFTDFPRLLVELRTHWGGFPGAEGWLRVITAVVHLRQGQATEARQALGQLALADLLPSADAGLLGQLAEVTAALGDRSLATQIYARLTSYSGWLMNCGLLGMYCEGPYDRQLGLLAVALGRAEDAERHFETAIARNRSLGLRPHLARVSFEYARALRALGDPRHAPRVQALLAESTVLARTLGQAGLLRQIEALAEAPVSAAHGPSAPAFALGREGDYWTVRWPDGVSRLRHSTGLETLCRLVSQPDREFHVTELAADGDGVIDGGDAGELLDDEARRAYRQRHAELSEHLAEAEAAGDTRAGARIQEELDFLAAELSRAVGLGGRPRRAGKASERARVAVQKRIKGAIRRIAVTAPALGHHLSSTIRTGQFCVYRPGVAAGDQSPAARAATSLAGNARL